MNTFERVLKIATEAGLSASPASASEKHANTATYHLGEAKAAEKQGNMKKMEEHKEAFKRHHTASSAHVLADHTGSGKVAADELSDAAHRASTKANEGWRKRVPGHRSF